MHRAICLAGLAGAPLYVVHLSTAQALAAVRGARPRPAGDGRDLPAVPVSHRPRVRAAWLRGAKFAMSPPLREAGHPETLWGGLADGSLQAAGHRPLQLLLRGARAGHALFQAAGRGRFHPHPQRRAGPRGRGFALMHEGAVVRHGFSLQRWVEITATAPARLFGLYPRKGTLAVGSDADVVLFDPAERWTVSGRAPQPGRLLDLRGASNHWPGEEGVLARPVHRRWRTMAGRAGQGQFETRPRGMPDPSPVHGASNHAPGIPHDRLRPDRRRPALAPYAETALAALGGLRINGASAAAAERTGRHRRHARGRLPAWR